MRNFKATTGPFKNRPYYTQDEIEQTCLDELGAVELLPSDPTAIRIDRFIEKKFGISHRYEVLPINILGFSLFGSKGVEVIVVAQSLEEESTDSSRRRINTTLAHEAGHALFQGHLFSLGKKPRSLFGNDETDEPKILCREGGDRDLGHGAYDGKWWEYQANQAIGALLLPKPLVGRALDEILTVTGSFGAKILDPSKRAQAINTLSEVFDVNPAAAKMRLDTLYPLSISCQLTL